MHQSIVALALTVASLGLLAICLTATADAYEPAYLILKQPTIVGGSHHSQKPVPALKQEVQARPYAYGWFGVEPRRHWSRSFGYYRNYTQWTGK